MSLSSFLMHPLVWYKLCCAYLHIGGTNCIVHRERGMLLFLQHSFLVMHFPSHKGLFLKSSISSLAKIFDKAPNRAHSVTLFPSFLLYLPWFSALAHSLIVSSTEASSNRLLFVCRFLYTRLFKLSAVLSVHSFCRAASLTTLSSPTVCNRFLSFDEYSINLLLFFPILLIFNEIFLMK